MLLSAKTEKDDSLENENRDSWVMLARDAYETSTDYFDANIRKRVENAMSHFQSRHAQGSKYYADSYKYRSKAFRPKTRSVIRRNEAAAAIAYFSTQEALSLSAENDSDPWQVFAAELNAALLNYRLENTIPWFTTLIGAYQDAMNTGIVIGHPNWEFEEDSDRNILTDKPRIDLIPIENFRFSQAADWQDPVGTSPYIIQLIPMFVGDIRDKAKKKDPKTGDPEWFDVTDKEIKAASEWHYDSVRSAREGRRQDAKDETHSYSDFDIAWVHKNVIRKDGEDWIFYTLGVIKMLSKPKKLREVYTHLRHRERPYVAGSCIIEAHKTYPDGVTTLVHQLQLEANDISNQRRDNVRQVLNKRYFGRRGAGVDWRMLSRSVPGSVVQMDDIERDVKPEEIPDVTGAAYEEQNRVNVDFDEISGSFSAGSVATNRQMNETVGGMNILKSDANIISEYQIRTFNETWVEPVLNQLLRMEQEYEDDKEIMEIIGANKQVLKYGMGSVDPSMLAGKMKLRIDVGFGSTSPEQRIQKIVLGLDSVLRHMPEKAAEMNFYEIVKEIFGALGYRGVDRFFPNAGMEGEVQEQPQEPPVDETKLQVAAINRQAQTEINKDKIDFEAWNAERERDLKRHELALREAEKAIGEVT